MSNVTKQDLVFVNRLKDAILVRYPEVLAEILADFREYIIQQASTDSVCGSTSPEDLKASEESEIDTEERKEFRQNVDEMLRWHRAEKRRVAKKALKEWPCPITGDRNDNSVTWHCEDCERSYRASQPKSPPTSEACRECKGTGLVEEDAAGALGYVVKRPCPVCPPTDRCRVCRGAKTVDGFTCEECNGFGHYASVEEVQAAADAIMPPTQEAWTCHHVPTKCSSREACLARIHSAYCNGCGEPKHKCDCPKPTPTTDGGGTSQEAQKLSAEVTALRVIIKDMGVEREELLRGYRAHAHEAERLRNVIEKAAISPPMAEPSATSQSVQKLSEEVSEWKPIDLRTCSTDNLMHRLWSKAVGTTGYVKEEWKELERRLWSKSPPTGEVRTVYTKTGEPVPTDEERAAIGNAKAEELWQRTDKATADVPQSDTACVYGCPWRAYACSTCLETMCNEEWDAAIEASAKEVERDLEWMDGIVGIEGVKSVASRVRKLKRSEAGREEL